MTLLEPAEIAIISDGQRELTDFGIQSSKMSYSLAPVDYPKYNNIILKIILRAVAKSHLIAKANLNQKPTKNISLFLP